MSTWEQNPRGSLLLAVGFMGVGAAFLVWRPLWSIPWTVMACGVGFGAQRWVSWKAVLSTSVVLFALAGADPLIWSAMGLAVSAWWERNHRERAKGKAQAPDCFHRRGASADLENGL